MSLLRANNAPLPDAFSHIGTIDAGRRSSGAQYFGGFTQRGLVRIGSILVAGVPQRAKDSFESRLYNFEDFTSMMMSVRLCFILSDLGSSDALIRNFLTFLLNLVLSACFLDTVGVSRNVYELSSH